MGSKRGSIPLPLVVLRVERSKDTSQCSLALATKSFYYVRTLRRCMAARFCFWGSSHRCRLQRCTGFVRRYSAVFVPREKRVTVPFWCCVCSWPISVTCPVWTFSRLLFFLQYPQEWNQKFYWIDWFAGHRSKNAFATRRKECCFWFRAAQFRKFSLRGNRNIVLRQIISFFFPAQRKEKNKIVFGFGVVRTRFQKFSLPS